MLYIYNIILDGFFKPLITSFFAHAWWRPLAIAPDHFCDEMKVFAYSSQRSGGAQSDTWLALRQVSDVTQLSRIAAGAEMQEPNESLKAFQRLRLSHNSLVLLVAEEGLEPPTRGL
jgi:hypothetical protein